MKSVAAFLLVSSPDKSPCNHCPKIFLSCVYKEEEARKEIIMLIDRNGNIAHVALVSDMNSDLSSVQTADGIWLDRTYELE